MKPLKFKFYATLLDTFQGYLNSSELYQQYWGNSKDASKTEEEFENEQFHNLLNTINRIPHEINEKADRGTAFNEVVDCIILKKKSEKMDISSNSVTGLITVKYDGFTFQFPTALCREFSNYFNGAIPQVYTEGILETKYGNVLLYGYIDELMPLAIHDIKTTTQYHAYKYRKNWQHRVYPFCMNQMGNSVRTFEYNITDFNNTYTEVYVYEPDRDIQELRIFCERFIEFLYMNSELITDKKIFAEEGILC